jgi:hypothetical protein
MAFLCEAPEMTPVCYGARVVQYAAFNEAFCRLVFVCGIISVFLYIHTKIRK